MSAWLLIALCAASGAYCVLRMRTGEGEEREVAGGEAVMGFGMAAMALPATISLPRPWAWQVYAAVFAALGLRALWALRRARGGTHHLHHLVGSLAMVYMALTMAPSMPGTGAHTGHTAHTGAGGVPLLTGVLLVYFAVFVLRSGARLVPVAAPPAAVPPAWGARPELALACQVSMGVAMVAMLLTV
ncbi:DUF5134 domain-containing protein [Streptomyces sp. NPDC127084]|uniref:DUF5134 domain-containing protein n=1 Tax=Streptomyces sp. NPDC127084 TaxID=3347133 RepID=UPI00365CA7D0